MEGYPWHQPAWLQLQRYIYQDRIPQALLIKGQKGLGKFELAKRFAKSLLCENLDTAANACGYCPSCLLFKAESHPDLLVIEAEEGKNITVKQIRKLLDQLSLKRQFEKYRVVIVQSADKLNHAAANAFLKYLEEPKERTCLFLITNRPSALPATILSRCQQFVVAKPNQDEMLAWLQQQQISGSLNLLSQLSQGSPLLALDYAKQNYVELRQECFNSWLAVARRQQHPVLVAEHWLTLPEMALLFWLTSWVMDLIKYLSTAKTGYLYNQDVAKSLQELSRQLELKSLYQWYDMLLISQQRMMTQINKQLLLEEILIEWSNLTRV